MELVSFGLPFDYVMDLPLEDVQGAYDSYIRIKAARSLDHLENINLGQSGGKEATNKMKDLRNTILNGLTPTAIDDQDDFKRRVGKGI